MNKTSTFFRQSFIQTHQSIFHAMTASSGWVAWANAAESGFQMPDGCCPLRLPVRAQLRKSTLCHTMTAGTTDPDSQPYDSLWRRRICTHLRVKCDATIPELRQVYGHNPLGCGIVSRIRRTKPMSWLLTVLPLLMSDRISYMPVGLFGSTTC